MQTISVKMVGGNPSERHHFGDLHIFGDITKKDHKEYVHKECVYDNYEESVGFRTVSAF
jgi:hypothetical protein